MALGAQPKLTVSQDTNQAHKKKVELENAWQNRDKFSSQYTSPLNQVTQEIINRPEFSYDFSEDPIYNQYRDQYVNEGMRASQNAQAQAAAATGGMGSSYSDLAGNLAYQKSLSQLANTATELSQQAYNRYQDEGQNLYNRANLLQGLEQTDYARYRDTMSDLWNDLQYAQSNYNFLSEQDYNYYKTNLDKWLSDRDYYYNKEAFDKDLAFRKKEANQNKEISDRQYEYDKKQLDKSNKELGNYWKKDADGNWNYYKNGEKATGWVKHSGQWYYLDNKGTMTTGWQKVNGKWYYLYKSGKMLTGTRDINGKTYKFGKNGEWIKK